jgi:CxxC motif-containing protein (DUF1111 family)
MGVRFRYNLMHDGDSLGTEAAIARHGGEATKVRHNYDSLMPREKQQVQTFLKSL